MVLAPFQYCAPRPVYLFMAPQLPVCAHSVPVFPVFTVIHSMDLSSVLIMTSIRLREKGRKSIASGAESLSHGGRRVNARDFLRDFLLLVHQAALFVP